MKKILILIICVLLLSGCTQTFKQCYEECHSKNFNKYFYTSCTPVNLLFTDKLCGEDINRTALKQHCLKECNYEDYK